jgi:pSer/pThr/pTyr-binding forkhead associated (FHA) protein/tetratricopeptide (TPR) repeat protein
VKLTAYKNNILYKDIIIPSIDIIDGAQFFIGRADDCHLVIEDQKISRYHLMINISNGKISLKNNSNYGNIILNGSYLGDEQEVSSKATISIDEYRIELDNGVDIPVAVQIIEENIESDDDQTVIQEPESSDIVEDVKEEEDDLNFTDDSPEEEVNSETEEGFGDFDASFTEEEGVVDNISDSTQVISNFADYELLLEGPDVPYDRYKIDTRETFVGRDKEKCNIILNDPEVSSVHAVFKKSLVNLVIEDLNSSNGVIINGQRVNKHELVNGDVIEIGPYKFTLDVISLLLESESEGLMPVEEGQFIEKEEVLEEVVEFGETTEGDFSAPVEEKGLKGMWKNPQKRKKLIYIMAGIAVLLLLLDDGESPTPPAAESVVAKVDTSSGDSADPNVTNFAKKDHSGDTLKVLEANYLIGQAKIQEGKFAEAQVELSKVVAIDPEYKQTQFLLKQVRQALEELKRIKEEEAIEKERIARQKKVRDLVERAREAVNEKKVELAETLFSQVFEIEPENIDVPQLKLELEAYKKEQNRIAMEKAQKEAERKRQVDLLAPGKNHYLKEDWNKAILALEQFLQLKEMDEDLVNEGTTMHREAKKNLAQIVSPLLGRARSFAEGQDLKRAYEVFGEVLKHEPSNEEAIIEREKIKDSLDAKAMRVYREALISESLSLFSDAKERLLEVQQIAPTDSEYYKKATEKLKSIME